MATDKQAKSASQAEKEAKNYGDGTGVINWNRPSGTSLQTNDSRETVEYCESLNWERAK